MKKILLFMTAALLFSCSESNDDDTQNSSENSAENTDGVFGESVSNNDTIEIIAGGETYSFNYYYLLEDEKNNYKSISCYNSNEGVESMVISIFYASEDRDTDWISINFNSDSKTLDNYYSYDNTVFQDDDPQDVFVEIIEDSETRFKVNFSGVMSSILRNDSPEYDTINVSSGVIDIEF